MIAIMKEPVATLEIDDNDEDQNRGEKICAVRRVRSIESFTKSRKFVRS